MSTFNPSDLFFLQRPSDTADLYKAVTRDSMKALGIMTSDIAPTNDEEGQLWFRPAINQLYIYEGGQWVEAAGSTHNLNLKVSRTGDSMTGDLIMLGGADVNFPLIGGLTLGNASAGGGHMVLVSYDTNFHPQGFLTIPSQGGGLDTIAKWDSLGLYTLKDPVDPAQVTHKQYVDEENHLQDLVIEQNTTNIIALFDDLESVRPSTLRAKYNYMIPASSGDLTPDGRIYFSDGSNILTTYTDLITEIHLNKEANNGITYDFSTVTQDFLVEVQDVKGIGIFLAEIDTITEVSDQIKLEVNVIKHRDEGTLVGDPDPTEVRVLIFKNNTEININGEDRFAKLFEPNTFTKSNTFKGPGVYIDSVSPLPGAVGYTNSTIFSVVNGATGVTPGKDRFKINAKGEVTAGTVPDPFMAQFDNDVVTKKYVDERMSRVGAYYGDTPPSNPGPGMLWYDTKEDDLTMYMYYENPDNTFVWVPVYSPSKGSGGGGTPFKPITDRNGQTYNTEDEFNKFIVNDFLYKNENDNFVVDLGEELEEETNVLEIKGRVGPTSSLNYGSLLTVKRREKLSPDSDYVTYDGSIDNPNSIATKDYVDRTEISLNEKVDNIKEQLEAISPVLVRGQWMIDHIGTAGRAPSPGFFAIYKIASNSPNYEFITDFIETHEVWIAEEDANNVLHDFTDDLTLDNYVYIYDTDDRDYVLGVITSLDEIIFRSNKYYKMIVKPIQAKGLPHDDDVCFIKIFSPPSGGDSSEFLPLAGGTMTGSLDFEGDGVFIDARNTSNLSDRAGLEIRCSGDKPLAISNSGSYQPTLEIYGYDSGSPGGRKRNLYITAGGDINLEGKVNAQDFVRGSELRSTKLTSGQSSNLEIYRGFGDEEKRKMLIGTDSVNLDVSLKFVGSEKDIVLKNGSQITTDVATDEIITFGGTGAFYRGTMSQDDHMINKGYVDDKFDFRNYTELS